MPGVRDRHSGCVSEYMVEHDLFDFLLLCLPDNDWYSHKHGPDGQLTSLAAADLQLARVMEAAGGIDEFLAEHAFIAMADHSQALVTDTIDLQGELAELGVLQPSGAVLGAHTRAAEEPRIAVCPSQRAAMVYALHPDERDAMRASVVARAWPDRGRGADLLAGARRARRPREGVISRPGPAAASCASPPAGTCATRAAWPGRRRRSVGARRVRARGREHLATPAYPDALARLWSALTCPTSGEVLLSAAPGYEFIDWGGAGARGRRLARLAARIRLAGPARAVRRRSAGRSSGAVGDQGRRRAGARAFRRLTGQASVARALATLPSTKLNWAANGKPPFGQPSGSRIPGGW